MLGLACQPSCLRLAIHSARFSSSWHGTIAMWWRTPWLRQRWQLIGLAMADALLVVFSYDALFQWRFGPWVGITPSVLGLMLLWVGTSYLLGRYTSTQEGQRDSRIRRLLSTVTVALVVLAIVVVGISWGIKIDDPRTFRNFVLPLLGSVSCGSALAQLWITHRNRRVRRWLLVGDREELAVLRGELRGSSHTSHLIFCDSGDLEAREIGRAHV